MASSSSPPEPDRDQASFPAENKEAIVNATETREDVQSSSASSGLPPAKAADEDEDDEATPTPPESSSLSSENGTVTLATTEEESLSVLLSHRTDGEGETGERSEQVRRLDLIFSQKVSQCSSGSSAAVSALTCLQVWTWTWTTAPPWSQQAAQTSSRSSQTPPPSPSLVWSCQMGSRQRRPSVPWTWRTVCPCPALLRVQRPAPRPLRSLV